MGIALVFSPIWFFGYDSFIDIISFLIIMLIGFYSYKIYKLSANKNYFLLYLAFLLLGMGLVIKSFANLSFYFDLLHKIGIYDTRIFGYQMAALALFLYVLLSLLGYITLISLTLKLKGKKIISLLFLLVIMTVLLAKNSFMFFHLISFLLVLIYITPYFYENYTKIKDIKAFFVFMCFFLLSFSHLLFTMVFYSNQLYVTGVIIQLGAYLMLLINLILVLKK